MATKIEDASQAIAANVPMSIGGPIDILNLIMTWLPAALQCLAVLHPGVSAKQFATDHYDEPSKTFDPHVLGQARPSIRRKARQNGLRHLGRDGLDAITTKALTHAMNAPDEVVMGCMSEAAAMPSDVTDETQV